MSYSIFASAFQTMDGFPRPDWDFIGNWIDKNVYKSRRYEAWDAAAETWLHKLRDHLGGSYAIDALDEFGLLSALPQPEARGTLEHARAAKKAIQEQLSRLPAPDFCGPHIIIAFQDLEEFITYVSYFHPDGEYGTPGGMCVREKGYMHIVLPPQRLDSLHHALTHEMTHVMLAHSSLPSWLEEGIAQILEEVGSGYSRFQLDREIAGRHQAYWRANGVQGFWSGHSFHQADEGMELSYGLAQVLVRMLSADYPDQFWSFVASAHRRDAGDAAIRQHIGISLAECAARFLGAGDWAIKSDALPKAGADVAGSSPGTRGGARSSESGHGIASRAFS